MFRNTWSKNHADFHFRVLLNWNKIKKTLSVSKAQFCVFIVMSQKMTKALNPGQVILSFLKAFFLHSANPKLTICTYTVKSDATVNVTDRWKIRETAKLSFLLKSSFIIFWPFVFPIPRAFVSLVSSLRFASPSACPSYAASASVHSPRLCYFALSPKWTIFRLILIV